MSDIGPDDSISQPLDSLFTTGDNPPAGESIISTTESSSNAIPLWKQSVFPTLKLSTLFYVHDQPTKLEASKFLNV